MSWYSDREPFDEHEPPYCAFCKGGTSYADCQACMREHEAEDEEDD